MLAGGLRQRGLFGVDERLKRVLPRILSATALMAGGLYLIQRPFAGWWSADLAHRGVALALLVGGGLAIYGAVIFATGAATMGELRGLFRRNRTLTAPPGGDNPSPSDLAASSSP
jgi:putative peptidoglycan lipid II flippase